MQVQSGLDAGLHSPFFAREIVVIAESQADAVAAHETESCGIVELRRAVVSRCDIGAGHAERARADDRRLHRKSRRAGQADDCQRKRTHRWDSFGDYALGYLSPY